MKILILGHGEHGKDYLANFIARELGVELRNVSDIAAETFVFDKLKDKYGYKDYKECFIDRRFHREEWVNSFEEYNKEDETRFIKDVLEVQPLYVGLRSQQTLDECKKQNIFDLIIGKLDKNKLLEPTMEIDLQKECDFIVDEDLNHPDTQWDLLNFIRDVKYSK